MCLCRCVLLPAPWLKVCRAAFHRWAGKLIDVVVTKGNLLAAFINISRREGAALVSHICKPERPWSIVDEVT